MDEHNVMFIFFLSQILTDCNLLISDLYVRIENSMSDNLTHCMLGNFSFSWRLLILSKLMFSKNYLRNTIIVSNSLHPQQVQHFVGPDLFPNRLQR